jgi:hypothetical protein
LKKERTYLTLFRIHMMDTISSIPHQTPPRTSHDGWSFDGFDGSKEKQITTPELMAFAFDPNFFDTLCPLTPPRTTNFAEPRQDSPPCLCGSQLPIALFHSSPQGRKLAGPLAPVELFSQSSPLKRQHVVGTSRLSPIHLTLGRRGSKIIDETESDEETVASRQRICQKKNRILKEDEPMRPILQKKHKKARKESVATKETCWKTYVLGTDNALDSDFHLIPLVSKYASIVLTSTSTSKTIAVLANTANATEEGTIAKDVVLVGYNAFLRVPLNKEGVSAYIGMDHKTIAKKSLVGFVFWDESRPEGHANATLSFESMGGGEDAKVRVVFSVHKNGFAATLGHLEEFTKVVWDSRNGDDDVQATRSGPHCPNKSKRVAGNRARKKAGACVPGQFILTVNGEEYRSNKDTTFLQLSPHPKNDTKQNKTPSAPRNVGKHVELQAGVSFGARNTTFIDCFMPLINLINMEDKSRTGTMISLYKGFSTAERKFVLLDLIQFFTMR